MNFTKAEWQIMKKAVGKAGLEMTEPTALEVYGRILQKIESEIRAIKPKRLSLKSRWCSCKPSDNSFCEAVFKDDGCCDCGIHKHHYHCPLCGKVTQIG
jgi:hypothetical protein